MPNWAGSCWYELRYLDPHERRTRWSTRRSSAYWMGRAGRAVRAPAARADTGGVDLYVGGVEHAVLHLLYARFWHKVLLRPAATCRAPEPFRRLFNQGYIQAVRVHRRPRLPRPRRGGGRDDVGDGARIFTWQGEPVTREYGKMGKR